MPNPREKVKAAIMEALSGLTEDERKLFGEVLTLEVEQLHLERPRIREDLVKIVKQVIK